MTYSPNIPTGTIPLNSDYITLRTNFQQLDSVYGTDHQAYSVTTTDATHHPGYHKAIHFNPPSTPTTNPANNYPPNGITNTSGYGQLIMPLVNDGNSTDSALYMNTSAGNTVQLTSNVLPVKAANGYTFIPGGLIYIWGIIAPTSSNAVVKLTGSGSLGLIQFPTAVINIQVTRQRTTASPGSSYSYWVDNTTVTTNGFTIINGDTHSYGYYWMALGY